MIHLLEKGKMHPPPGLCADAKAVYDAIAASDVCELAGCSLKFHPISVRDRMTRGGGKEILLGRRPGHVGRWYDQRKDRSIVVPSGFQWLRI